MAEHLIKGEIPPSLVEHLAGRDTTPLTADMLVKYQYIALMPTRATNFRFIVYTDGRLYYASNSEEENDPVYNTPLPGEPNRTLSAEILADIEAKLEAVEFFKQPPYIAIPARDGAVAIVTARQNDQVHEVWYSNVDNDLTNLLFSITPTEPVQRTPEEELAHWQSVLSDLEQQYTAQQADLMDDSADEIENSSALNEGNDP